MSAPWLINKPASPSIWDDEFETNELDSRWTKLIPGVHDFTSVSTFDPYAAFTTGNHRYSINAHRKSWLMIQPVASYGVGPNGINQGWKMDISGLPTNAFIYARVSTSERRASIADGDGEVWLFPRDSLGTSFILCGMDTFGSIREGLFARAAPSVAYANLGLIRNYFGEGFPLEYIGLQKRGLTWDGWVAPASGNWVWMGTYTHLVALTELWLCFNNQTSAAPGNMILGADYVRVISGKGPP
jgi:hypothetical protein